MALSRRGQDHRIGAQVQVVGGEIACWSPGRTSSLGRLHGWLDDSGDPDCDLILQVENIFQGAVETVGPEMRAGFRLDQLRGNPHATGGLAYRAFQHVTNAQFAGYPLHIDGLPFVREARITGDYEQPTDATEGCDDFLDHPINEIFLLRVAAHVLEREDGNRGLVRGGERRG